MAATPKINAIVNTNITPRYALPAVAVPVMKDRTKKIPTTNPQPNRMILDSDLSDFISDIVQHPLWVSTSLSVYHCLGDWYRPKADVKNATAELLPVLTN